MSAGTKSTVAGRTPIAQPTRRPDVDVFPRSAAKSAPKSNVVAGTSLITCVLPGSTSGAPSHAIMVASASAGPTRERATRNMRSPLRAPNKGVT
jgi:hypothetical protein